MASPPFQIAAFFIDADGRGWSEKYFTGTNLTQTQADSFVAAYVPARMALSTNSITLTHIRVGSAVTRSPFAYYPTPADGSVGTLQPPTLPSDSGLLVALFSSARYKNNVFLRGLPQTVVALEEKVADSTWDANFSAFVTAMLGTGFLVVRTVLGTAYTPKTIVTITHNTPKGIRLVIPATDSLNVGDVIRIHGVDIPGYNGLKTVTQSIGAGGGGNVYYLGGANPISDPSPTLTPYYTKPAVQFPGLASMIVERPANRKVGRPFGLSRGRARTLFSQRP